MLKTVFKPTQPQADAVVAQGGWCRDSSAADGSQFADGAQSSTPPDHFRSTEGDDQLAAAAACAVAAQEQPAVGDELLRSLSLQAPSLADESETRCAFRT